VYVERCIFDISLYVEALCRGKVVLVGIIVSLNTSAIRILMIIMELFV